MLRRLAGSFDPPGPAARAASALVAARARVGRAPYPGFCPFECACALPLTAALLRLRCPIADARGTAHPTSRPPPEKVLRSDSSPPATPRPAPAPAWPTNGTYLMGRCSSLALRPRAPRVPAETSPARRRLRAPPTSGSQRPAPALRPGDVTNRCGPAPARELSGA